MISGSLPLVNMLGMSMAPSRYRMHRGKDGKSGLVACLGQLPFFRGFGAQ